MAGVSRSCAQRVFFCQLHRAQRPPDGRVADGLVSLGVVPLRQLGNRGVGLRGNQRAKTLSARRVDEVGATAAHLRWLEAARQPAATQQVAQGRAADAEPVSDLLQGAFTVVVRFDGADTEIHRQGRT
jgi:hypothetical protein